MEKGMKCESLDGESCDSGGCSNAQFVLEYRLLRQWMRKDLPVPAVPDNSAAECMLPD